MQVKNKKEYGQHEDGNTLSFQDFQDYLDSEEFKAERPDVKYGISVKDDLVPRMKDIVIDTFLASKSSLNPNHRKNHFELFGYDFMIDEDFRVWLIEINTNPCNDTPIEFIR